MALSQRLATPPAPKPTLTGMDRWVAGLDAEDAEFVWRAVRNPEWRHTDLLAELVAEGAPKIAATTFATWRKNRGWSK